MPEETPQEQVARLADEADAWSAKNIADGGVCDFCCALLADKPVVTYTTTKPLVEHMIAVGPDGDGVLTHVSDEYWAACPDCDPVIQKGDPLVLATHVAETANYDRIGIERDVPAEILKLTPFYRRFFEATPTRTPGPPQIGEAK